MTRRRGVEIGIGMQLANPPKRDVSVGSSEDSDTPKSVQATESDPVMCHHVMVNWRGTNGHQWQWNCESCDMVEKVPKRAGAEAPNPADKPRLVKIPRATDGPRARHIQKIARQVDW